MSASASTHLSRNKLWNHWDDGAIMEPCLWNPIYLSSPFQSLPEMSNSGAVLGVLHQDSLRVQKCSFYVYKAFLRKSHLWVMVILTDSVAACTVGVEKVLSQESVVRNFCCSVAAYRRRQAATSIVAEKSCRKIAKNFRRKKFLEKLKK